MEQLHSGQLYNSEHGIHVGEKLRKTQKCNILAAKSGEILEDSLEWVGLFDKFSNELSARLPIFPSSDLYTIEK